MTITHTSNFIRREACPKCQAEGRDLNEDNLAVYDDGHTYCFACNSLDNENIVYGKDYTYEYLPWRGVTADTYRKYKSKTKIDHNGKPVSIGYKYPNNSYKIRLLDKKEFYVEGAINEAGLFGSDLFVAGGNSVIITEGEQDALSAYQMLKIPAVSVQSSSTAVRDCSATRSWLDTYKIIYLCFDADRTGKDACRGVASLFDYNKVRILDLGAVGRKDASECLEHDAVDVFYSQWKTAKKYVPDSIIYQFEDFKKILEETPKVSAKYPFQMLNEKTDGLRTGESVLITAQEGVGKTELMHAIEYHLLETTDAAIGSIFLEEPKRRHLQALSSIKLEKPVYLERESLTDSDVYSALVGLLGGRERLFIYNHFGSSDPDDLVDVIRFLVAACGVNYILLDHITMGTCGIGGEDERKALDYLSNRLEMLVKELDFCLIFVSHVNDDGKTRGSRLISKVADIRIDLQRNLTHPDINEQRRTHITVSKNRFCGRTGYAGSIIFNPSTCRFTEESSFQASSSNDNGAIDNGQRAA